MSNNDNSYLIFRKYQFWDDKSPIYYLGEKNKNKHLVHIGAKVIIEKELGGEIKFLGYAEVASIEKDDGKTRRVEYTFGQDTQINEGYNVYFKNYVKFQPPRTKSNEIRRKLNLIPNYQWYDTIRPLTKEMFHEIVDFCSEENWRLYLDEIPSTHSQYVTLNQLLLENESEILEYKTSMLTITKPPEKLIRLKEDLKTTNKDKNEIQRAINLIESEQKKKIQEDIVIAIVSFLNSKGGTLIVGVDDNKKIIGIENDYQRLSRKKDWDEWVLELRNLLNKYIETEVISQLHLTQILKNSKTIVRIDVPPSPKPIYIKYENDEKFYIRSLNSSEKLSPRQSHEYINERWKNS